jgi:F0F1-type ATP synthase alpha subunit
VSRVGGRGQSDRQKHLGGTMFKTLTAHAQAQEFARFGSELAPEAMQSLKRGTLLFKLLNQIPGERFTLTAQTLMLDIALNLEDNQSINIELLKKTVGDFAKQIKEDKDFDKARDDLKKSVLMAPGPVEAKK